MYGPAHKAKRRASAALIANGVVLHCPECGEPLTLDDFQQDHHTDRPMCAHCNASNGASGRG